MTIFIGKKIRLIPKNGKNLLVNGKRIPSDMEENRDGRIFTTDAWVIVDGTHNKIEEIVACKKTLLRRQMARQFILSMMELNVLI